MEVISCAEKERMACSAIVNYLQSLYEGKEMSIYVLDDNGNIGYVVELEDGYRYFVLNNNKLKEMMSFNVDENGVNYIATHSYQASFDDHLSYNEYGDLITEVSLIEIPNQGSGEFNGSVCFQQYDKKRDTLCDIRYQQMYHHDGKTRFPFISPWHISKIDSVFIIPNYSKNMNKKGLVSNFDCYFYEKDPRRMIEILRDTIAPSMEENNGNVRSYAKIGLILPDGNCVRQIGSSLVSEEELIAKIEVNGFAHEIPDRVIALNNGFSDDVKKIQEMINAIEKAKGNKDLVMKIEWVE